MGYQSLETTFPKSRDVSRPSEKTTRRLVPRPKLLLLLLHGTCFAYL